MNSYCNYIPYSSHINDTVVKLRNDGSFISVIKLTGLQSIGKDKSELDKKTSTLCSLLSSLKAPSSFHVSYHTQIIRYEKLPVELGEAKNNFISKLDQGYKSKIAERPLMTTDLFLSIIYRPFRRLERKAVKLKTIEDYKKLESVSANKLNKIVQHVVSSLADYGPKVLSTYLYKENEYSEVLEYFHLSIMGSYKRIPLLRAPIYSYLFTHKITYGNSEKILVEDFPNKTYLANISIIEYPTSTFNNCLLALFNLDIPFSFSQSFVPMDKVDALKWLNQTSNKMNNTDSASEKEKIEIEIMMDGVKADTHIIGNIVINLIVRAENAMQLDNNLSRAKAAMTESGYVAEVNSLAKVRALFSALPGNHNQRIRNAVVSSINASHMMPFFRQSRGKALKNPWGPAICYFRTKSGEPFYFNFHDPVIGEDRTGELDLGNTLIMGSPGEGKTAILNYLLAMSQRLPVLPRIISFDKDLGSAVFVKAMGGDYIELKKGNPSGMAPFACSYSKENEANLIEFVKVLTAKPGEFHTAKNENLIKKAVVDILKQKDPCLKTVTALQNYFPDDGEDSIRERLTKWTNEGQFGWLFDNEVDRFDMSENHIFGLDYTEFLDIPEIICPTLMYLLAKVEQMLDGYPMILALDEVWKAFKIPYFSEYLEDKLRTTRKENGVCVLSTQSPGDYISGASQNLLGLIGTKIILPNNNPIKTQYMVDEKGHGLGLTEAEFKIVESLRSKSREFLIKQSSESVVCSLDLNNINELKVLSGSEERYRMVQKLSQNNPNWVAEYCNHNIGEKYEVR